jgi:magnesium chelatase family protein
MLGKPAVVEGIDVFAVKSRSETVDLWARAHDRILKVARTIADLVGSESLEPKHLRSIPATAKSYNFGG